MRRQLWGVVLLGLVSVSSAGLSQQVFPLTKERQQAIDALIAASVKAGAIDLPDAGPVRIDEKKLRAVMADRRDKINADLVEALVAFWFDVEERREPIAVELLRAYGTEKKDERALGFAAFLSGMMAERQPKLWSAATDHYASAEKHFSTAKDLNWVASSLNNQGMVLKKRGLYTQAEPLFVRAVEMNEKLYPKDRFPKGHSELARSLNNLAFLYDAQAEYTKAEPLLRRVLKMSEEMFPESTFPNGHPLIAVTCNNLGMLHNTQGELAKAEPLLRRALEINEVLYPKEQFPTGHPNLAHSLHNLAVLYRDQGEYARAEKLLTRALAMRDALYPKARFPQGQPELASTIVGLGTIYLETDDPARAEPLFRRALEMNESLYPKERYPDGHPALPVSLNNLGGLYFSTGEYDKADPLFRRALEITDRLYPKKNYPHGHIKAAHCISNLAALLRTRGENAKAEPLYRQAMNIYMASAMNLAATGAEATALNYLATLPGLRDSYLSATRDIPAASSYLAVWESKAVLTRIYERRHLAALASADPKARKLWDEMVLLRRAREGLLLAPVEPGKNPERDKRLEQIEDGIRQRELALLQVVPMLKRTQEIEKATPDDLRKALPAGTALVDFVRYVRVEQDAKLKGRQGLKRTPHFTCFVLTRDAVTRVELGEARVLEEVLGLWRRAVTEGSSSEPEYATKMHRLVWTPVVPHLPKNPTLIHIGPDAALHSLPWSALRAPGTGRVLMEDHAVAVVPHGPMLLDRLTQEKRQQAGKLAVLAMGGVEYDKSPSRGIELAMRSPVAEGATWKPLLATRKELDQIIKLASDKKVTRREGADTGVATLLGDLPSVQVAHLATHGFFADQKFRSVLQLDEKLFQRTEFATGGTAQRFGAGARSPLVLSGLVCAGANVKETPNRGILTAEAIVGLDLRKMDLAVLSACETGLGDVAGGEGVYGLTRAFHIAGCRNVCASLWHVEDEATAALMVLFYRQLWGKEPVPPAEALRRAQLALYREPEHVKDWSVGRGPLPRPVGGGKNVEKVPQLKVGATRTWAAFVLSGPGN